MCPKIAPPSYVLYINIRNMMYSSVKCDFKSKALYKPYYTRSRAMLTLCRHWLLDLFIYATNTYKNKQQKVQRVSPAYTFSSGKTTLLCVSSVRIRQHKHSAVLLNKQLPTTSAAHARHTHVKGHLRPVTLQMAFVPVTCLGWFVLCVWINRLLCVCVLCVPQ